MASPAPPRPTIEVVCLTVPPSAVVVWATALPRLAVAPPGGGGGRSTGGRLGVVTGSAEVAGETSVVTGATAFATGPPAVGWAAFAPAAGAVGADWLGALAAGACAAPVVLAA